MKLVQSLFFINWHILCVKKLNWAVFLILPWVLVSCTTLNNTSSSRQSSRKLASDTEMVIIVNSKKVQLQRFQEREQELNNKIDALRERVQICGQSVSDIDRFKEGYMVFLSRKINKFSQVLNEGYQTAMQQTDPSVRPIRFMLGVPNRKSMDEAQENVSHFFNEVNSSFDGMTSRYEKHCGKIPSNNFVKKTDNPKRKAKFHQHHQFHKGDHQMEQQTARQIKYEIDGLLSQVDYQLDQLLSKKSKYTPNCEEATRLRESEISQYVQYLGDIYTANVTMRRNVVWITDSQEAMKEEYQRGFAKMSALFKPKEINDVIRRYDEAVRECISRFSEEEFR